MVWSGGVEPNRWNHAGTPTGLFGGSTEISVDIMIEDINPWNYKG
jgi:hypothetical protein